MTDKKQIKLKHAPYRLMCRRPAKASLLLILTTTILLSVSGCSVLVATPPTAHVQIDGLNRQLGEFMVSLNPCDEQRLDIRLSERYALRLDFMWLWNQDNSDLPVFAQQDPAEDVYRPLTPWMMCKFRF